MTNRKKNASFEKSFAELEVIVSRLESGELSLDDSLTAFEKGVSLCKSCRDILSTAEQKVQKLLIDNGQQVLSEFYDSEPEGNVDGD